MEYSHYVTLPLFYKESIFIDFTLDVNSIIENAPEGADLCGEEHDSKPIVNKDILVIGSRASESPFSVLKIDANKSPIKFRYPLCLVMTNRLPYDSVICACMLALKHHFPSTMITTDGTREDWKLPFALYEYATMRLAPKVEFMNKG